MLEETQHLLTPLYENEYAAYWLEEDILIQQHKESASYITLAIAETIVRDRQLITKGMPTLHFADMGRLARGDVDAMEYFVSPESTNDVLASALCLHNYLQFTIVNIFLIYYQRHIPFPTKVVKNRQQGIAWLKEKEREMLFKL